MSTSAEVHMLIKTYKSVKILYENWALSKNLAILTDGKVCKHLNITSIIFMNFTLHS
jgi:hypothetical protein